MMLTMVFGIWSSARRFCRNSCTWRIFAPRSSADADAPFILCLSFQAPHSPLQASRADILKYRGKYLGGWQVIREARFKHWQSGTGWACASVTPWRLCKISQHAGGMTTEAIRCCDGALATAA